jgi:MAF protein
MSSDLKQISHTPILLASSSPYRASLLSQLGLAFDTCSPDIDESPLENESPCDLARRLSLAKALELKDKYPNHIIIASDQVASVSGSDKPLGKPLRISNAIKQLQDCSAKTVRFYTGLSVIAPASFNNPQVPKAQTLVESFDVQFRALTLSQIERYIEKPLDCAGSFKAEGLGIALFERFEGRDYNTLIGLPLMALVDCFSALGIDVLQLQNSNTLHSNN